MARYGSQAGHMTASLAWHKTNCESAAGQHSGHCLSP
jgi:hypothetical protein